MPPRSRSGPAPVFPWHELHGAAPGLRCGQSPHALSRSFEQTMIPGNFNNNLWFATGAGVLVVFLCWSLYSSRRRCRRLGERLVRREFQLELAMGFTRDVIVLAAGNGVIEFASSSSESTLGYRSEELVGLSVQVLLTDDPPSGLLRPDNGEPRTYRVRRADGTPRWFDITSVGARLEDRSYVVLTFRDVTARCLAQEESKREKDLVDTIINAMPAVFFVWDERGRYVRWNDNLETVTGYSAEELARISPGDLVDMDNEALRSSVRMAFDEGHVMGESSLIRKDGVHIPYVFTGHRFVAEGRRYLVGVGLNISQRLQIERSFRQSVDLVRHLVEVSPAGIALLDTDWRVVSASPALCRMLQTDSARMVGQPLPTLLHADENQCNALCDWLGGGARHELEQEVRRADGNLLLVRIIPASLPAGSGDGPGLLLVFEDETVRHRHESQLEYYARSLEDAGRRQLDALERERRDIARELHDGLGQLLTAVRLRLNNGLATDDRAERLGLLKQADDEIGQALDDVRRLSRNLRPSALDDFGLDAALRWLVESVTSALAKPPALDIRIADLDRQLDPEIETACFRIAQEALTNAVKYARANTIRVELVAGGEGLSLEVSDDGSGFDVAVAREAASNGKSFGMVSMRERAHLVGGTLTICSAPDAGTQITAWLPYSPRPALGIETNRGGVRKNNDEQSHETITGR